MTLAGRCLGTGLLAALLSPGPPAGATGDCAPEARQATAAAWRLLEEADEIGAAELLRGALPRHGECAELAVAFWAMAGLRHARHAATRGGPPELLEPVGEAIEQLAVWRVAPGAVRQAEYAQSALRAGMAAAQDERPEMEVWLTHATDIAAQLELAGEPPRWPLPAPWLAGDLWYEVDRYADAYDAYRRALDEAPSAYAHRGLARTLNRMRDVPGACAAYRALAAWLAARQRDGAALEEARHFLERPACGRWEP